MKFPFCTPLILSLICSLPGIDIVSAEEVTDRLAEQRRAFREVYPRAELGDWRPAAAKEKLLGDYVLWPDLRAVWLRSRIRNHDYADVPTYLEGYATLKPARELRYQFAVSLGSSGNLPKYYQIYQQFYQGMEIAKLDCLALQAEIAAGRESKIDTRGVEKWLIAGNQVAECDPIFDNLRRRGVIAEHQYRQRFELAIAAREFAIARYLSRSLPDSYVNRAQQWSKVANDPESYLHGPLPSQNTADRLSQIIYAVERLAYRKPLIAAQYWRDSAISRPFSESQLHNTSRHIALWAARHHEPVAKTLLANIPPGARDTEVARWTARSALLQHDWRGVIDAISKMSADERQEEAWRYWLGAANKKLGETADANVALDTLANERSFFGFLAADLIGRQYSFSDERISADEPTILAFSVRPEVIRARELYFVGLEARGRSEWDAATALLSAKGKQQASILAHRWGWHSRAIATLAKGGNLNDLKIRFPLPYQASFRAHTAASPVRESWAYGVARSESLFMRDIRSSAGAIGLMQLLPETGRRTAKEISHPYAGTTTLVDPDSNIRLGTAYLAKMYERFDRNSVLATAAYNAGPLNVENWLPEAGSLDALIWIENIPFNETRNYVKRVLAMDTIFNWRLNGNARRLSAQLEDIVAPSAIQQSAARN